MSLILILSNTQGIQDAWADGWSGSASMTEKGEYDDNPNLVVTGGEGAFGVTSTPALAIRKIMPRTAIDAAASLDINVFDGDGGQGGGNLNSIDQHVKANIATHSLRNAVGFGIRHDRESARTSEIEDTGNLGEDATRQSFAGDASYSYQISRRNFFDVFGDAEDVSFDTGNLSGFRSYGAGVAYRHVLSTTDELGLVANYGRFDPESNFDSSSENVSLSGTWDRQVSPQLAFDVSLGGELVRSDGSALDDKTSIGFTVEGSLGWKPGERDTLTFSIERAAKPSSNGALQEKITARAKYNRVLTRSLGFGLDINFFQQDAINGGGTAKRTFFEAAPTISWNFHPDWALSTSYRYRQQEIGNGGDSATSNAVFLSISYSSPYVSLF